MASAGDIATLEALAATALLREAFPDLKLRFVNVVDLFKLQPESEHPHGLPDRDFDSLFTADAPIIFNFHGYPWLVHRLAYRRKNHENLHVRGYKEKGSINTPLELAIENNIDRFSLAMDVIDRVPRLRTAARTRRSGSATGRSSAGSMRTSTASIRRSSPAGGGSCAKGEARPARPPALRSSSLEHVQDVVVRGERAPAHRARLDALHDLLAREIEDRVQDLRALRRARLPHDEQHAGAVLDVAGREELALQELHDDARLGAIEAGRIAAADPARRRTRSSTHCDSPRPCRTARG